MLPREAASAPCAACASDQVARVLSAKQRSHSTSGSVASWLGRDCPALETRVSSPPAQAMACRTASVAAAWSVRSA